MDQNDLKQIGEVIREEMGNVIEGNLMPVLEDLKNQMLMK